MVTISDVKLPSRTRARYEEEANKSKASKPHDIRSAIPLVDYTNPAKFPPYMFREYPKMPLLDLNKPIVIDESGGVLVFYDATDEVEFKEMNPEIADEIERNAPAKQIAERYAALEEEVEELKKKLAEAGIETAPVRPSGLAGLVRSNEEDPPEGGLKAQVRKAADNAQNGNRNPLKKN